MSEVKTTEELRETIKKSLEYHLSEADKFKKLLSVLDGESAIVKLSNPINGSVKTSTTIGDTKKTFHDYVVNLLYEVDAPLLTRTIGNMFSIYSGQETTRKDVSSRLITEAKKGKIVKVVRPEQPNNLRHWWVLKEWTKHGVLLPVYQHILDDILKNPANSEVSR
ncbi:MAG: hypothetical protein IPN88_17815 [Bacteroidetes bacterium]|nr:hypothetical protein [Bacteroidota bacterium]